MAWGMSRAELMVSWTGAIGGSSGSVDGGSAGGGTGRAEVGGGVAAVGMVAGMVAEAAEGSAPLTASEAPGSAGAVSIGVVQAGSSSGMAKRLRRAARLVGRDGRGKAACAPGSAVWM